jgi:crossover junction endodeoxyribonuclease RusA
MPNQNKDKGYAYEQSILAMKSFFIPGNPIPQGSMKIIGKRMIHTRQKDLYAWRQAVWEAAQGAGITPLTGSVTVDAWFYMERKKSVTRDEPNVRPDLDKLTRAILDALTGVAYTDDAQVTRINVSKEYAKALDSVGVCVTVTQG